MLTKIANSPRTLALLMITTILIAALVYSITEGKGYDVSLWWAMITASTVGYGDAYPTSTPGRATAVALVALVVIFFIPMITASMASKLIVDRNVWTDEEQEEVKHLLRRINLMNDEVLKAMHQAVPDEYADGQAYVPDNSDESQV